MTFDSSCSKQDMHFQYSKKKLLCIKGRYSYLILIRQTEAKQSLTGSLVRLLMHSLNGDPTILVTRPKPQTVSCNASWETYLGANVALILIGMQEMMNMRRRSGKDDHAHHLLGSQMYGGIQYEVSPISSNSAPELKSPRQSYQQFQMVPSHQSQAP